MLLLLLSVACKSAPPAGNPEFSDAAVYAFVSFEAPEADLAYVLRQLEAQIYVSMDVEAKNAQDRALTLTRLTDEDVSAIEHPGRVVADAIPVAVAGLSPHPIPAHQRVQLMEDQRPVEPYSPDFYTRTFLEGTEACWADQGCPDLHTWNDLVKDNFLMTIPYEFFKDFRWVDLDLQDPAEVEPGEEPQGDGSPRWAFAGRSWTTQEYAGEDGKASILQSYTIEVWLPRDGGGFVRDGTETDGRTADSSGGGALRMLALWSETELGIQVSEDMVAGTTRDGIDKNFKAGDAWITEQGW